MAATVRLRWDLSTSDPDLGTGGYHIYMTRTPGVYTTPSVSVPKGITGVQIEGIKSGNTCFVATAFDSDNNESDYSNEVCKVITPDSPVLIDVIKVK